MHFVKTGVISKDFAKLYVDLLDWRGKGDYDDMYDFTEEIVSPLLVPAEQFLNEIERLITK